jgi:L-ascorbate metabolism protein UlaG (beta-lactamase superfamily)
MRPRALALAALFLVSACSKKPPTVRSEPHGQPAPSTIPAASANAAITPGSDVVTTTLGDVKITPLNHATMLLSVKGAAIYVDPTAKAGYEGLPRADVVFITDVHPDHLDPEGLARVSQADTVIVAPPAVVEKLPAGSKNVVTMKNGDQRASKAPVSPKLGPSFAVEAVPMYNLTRGPAAGKRFHDKGRGNGYVLSFGDKRFYVSGDTECTPEMKALTNIDVAFVCMNLPYTMPPAEAAACVAAFKPKVLYPYHYRGQKPEAVKATVEAAGVELRLREWY